MYLFHVASFLQRTHKTICLQAAMSTLNYVKYIGYSYN
jgi:hypothetical protein